MFVIEGSLRSDTGMQPVGRNQYLADGDFSVMDDMDFAVDELRKRKAQLKLGGGIDAIERLYHSKGMLTARERIETLLDPGTFVEMDVFVAHHCSNFGMDKRDLPSEGVITGHGMIDGRKVFLFSQDYTVMGGSFGEMHGRKICKVLDMAASVGSPVIGICHSGGVRLHEILGPMEANGVLFFKNTIYSGVIPQISLIMGTVAGGQAYSPGLTDFVFMTKKSSMYIAGPAFVKTQLGADVSEEELGGAMTHSHNNSLVDIVADDDNNCLELTRELIGFLPLSNKKKPPKKSQGKDPGPTANDIYRLVPSNFKRPYEMKKLIAMFVDDGNFFELKANYARSMITCFARFNGRSVGIIANQPLVSAGVIDCHAAEKAARFIRFCDAFGIPIVSFMDTPAYMIGIQEEKKGIIYRGAKLLHAYSEATVPKITVIVRKAYAGAYVAMGSRYLGADQIFSWPIAEIVSVAPDTAAGVIFRREIMEAEDPEEVRKVRFQEYNEKFVNPYNAAARQDVDDIIEPVETRKKIVEALEMLKDKVETRPWKKHGNIPL